MHGRFYVLIRMDVSDTSLTLSWTVMLLLQALAEAATWHGRIPLLQQRSIPQTAGTAHAAWAQAASGTSWAAGRSPRAAMHAQPPTLPSCSGAWSMAAAPQLPLVCRHCWVLVVCLAWTASANNGAGHRKEHLQQRWNIMSDILESRLLIIREPGAGLTEEHATEAWEVMQGKLSDSVDAMKSARGYYT